MAQYLFDIDDDGERLPADQSYAFVDVDAARSEALRALADIMGEALLTNGHERRLSITVRNEGGSAVFRASLIYRAEVFDEGFPLGPPRQPHSGS